MNLLKRISQLILSLSSTEEEVEEVAEATQNKLKHLDYIQAAIARMAQNSFLFKGWSVTLASGLSAFGAVQSKVALLVMSLITTILFWGMDAYYLWLERGFVKLHQRVAGLPESQIDFNMQIDKKRAFLKWFSTCLRPHLLLFYGSLILVIVIGICKLKVEK